MKQLQELLKEMDVPELRKNDLRWLSRNLAIRNKDNPKLQEALNLIKELLK